MLGVHTTLQPFSVRDNMRSDNVNNHSQTNLCRPFPYYKLDDINASKSKPTLKMASTHFRKINLAPEKNTYHIFKHPTHRRDRVGETDIDVYYYKKETKDKHKKSWKKHGREKHAGAYRSGTLVYPTLHSMEKNE